MKINTAKQKMLKGEVCLGFAVGTGSPLVTELIAGSGCDYVLLDNQHGSWGPDSTIMSLMAARNAAATPFARVARLDYTMIGRLLDEGCMGIIVPMVHTPEQAKEAADAMRFPPAGQRSWGWASARNYGDDYAMWVNDQVFLAVQIESAQAVENVEAIMATPGVDGCWVGPGDLAFSMGIHPKDQKQSKEHRAALEKIVAACKKTGKVPGFACGGVEDAIEKYEMGYRFLTVASDMGFMLNGAANTLKGLSHLK